MRVGEGRAPAKARHGPSPHRVGEIGGGVKVQTRGQYRGVRGSQARPRGVTTRPLGGSKTPLTPLHIRGRPCDGAAAWSVYTQRVYRVMCVVSRDLPVSRDTLFYCCIDLKFPYTNFSFKLVLSRQVFFSDAILSIIAAKVILMDQKNGLERRVSRFCTFCDKKLASKRKKNEKVMAI